MKKTIKNAMSSLTAKLAALLFAFTCAGTAWGANVAKIGNAEYTSLANAVAAVPTDGTATTIVMLSDVKLSAYVTIAATKNVTLDLNGKTITTTVSSGKHKYAIANNGTLVLKDSAGTGSISARGVYNGFDSTTATMTIESGTYTAIDTDGGAAILNKGKLVVNGGTFNGKMCMYNSGSAAKMTVNGATVNGADDYAIKNVSGGTLTINDITVNGAYGAFTQDDGATTINGGTFAFTGVEGSKTYDAYVTGGSLTIAGGSFLKTGNLDLTDEGSCILLVDSPAAATVKGGEFASAVDTAAGLFSGAISVKGGSFEIKNGTAADVAGYAAPGYAIVNFSGNTSLYRVFMDNWERPDYADLSWYTANPSASTFEISSAAQFAGLAQLVNGKALNADGTPCGTSGGVTFSQKTITLTADIDLSAHGWVPIGYDFYTRDANVDYATKSFYGTLDGGGHTIKLVLSEQNSIYDDDALFGSVRGGTLKNIVLDATISYPGEISAGYWNPNIYGAASGLVTFITGGVVSNVTMNGSVVMGSRGASGAGLVGYAFYGPKFYDCVNNTSVLIKQYYVKEADKKDGCYIIWGGIVVQTTGTASDPVPAALFTRCVNNATVVMENPYNNDRMLGGSANGYGSMNKLSANGETAFYSRRLHAGGIVGQLANSGYLIQIVDCKDNGSIVGGHAEKFDSEGHYSALYQKGSFYGKVYEGGSSTPVDYSIDTSDQKNKVFYTYDNTYIFNAEEVDLSSCTYHGEGSYYRPSTSSSGKIVQKVGGAEVEVTDADTIASLNNCARLVGPVIKQTSRVVFQTIPNYVAQIERNGEVTKYTSAQEALDLVQSGDTLTLYAGDHGTLYIRQSKTKSLIVDVTHQDGEYGPNDLYRALANVTIKGQEGACVNQIIFEAGYYAAGASSWGADWDRIIDSLMEIDNLTIDGVTFGLDKNTAAIKLGDQIRVTGLTVENCTVNGTGNYGDSERLLYNTLASKEYVSENRALVANKIEKDDVNFTSGLKDLTITGCTFNNLYQVAELRNLENLTFSGNTVKGNKKQTLLITKNTGDSVSVSGKVTIANNNIDGTTDDRVFRLSSVNAEVSITGNTITSYAHNEADLIKISGSGADAEYTIAGNNWSGTTSGLHVISDKDTTSDSDLVAKIGNKYFTSLADAYAELKSGETIVLLADIEGPVEFYRWDLATTDVFTLDLNGYAITSTSGATLKLRQMPQLVIKDSSEEHTGRIEALSTSSNAIDFPTVESKNNRGKLTIEGGTIRAQSVAIINRNATCRIVIDGEYANVISQNNSAIQINKPSAVVEINNGTVQGKDSGLLVNMANTVEINGGCINGGTYGARLATPGAVTTLKINDGSFYGDTDGLSYASTKTKFISGGLYSSEPAAKWIKDGYVVMANDDSKTSETYPWKVVEAANAVAKIGSVGYTTLADAIAAAQDGDTITLLADCETGSQYTITNPLVLTADNVTLDLNGKTLTTTSNFSFLISGDNDVVMNGTIQAGANTDKKTGINSYSIVVNGCDGVKLTGLTVNGGISIGGSTGQTPNAAAATNVLIEDCTVTSGDFYAVCAQQNSTVTITGGTYTADSRSTYSGVIQGTFTGTDGPKGTVSVTGGTFNGKIGKNDTGDIVISGGNFSTQVRQEYCAEGYKPTDAIEIEGVTYYTVEIDNDVMVIKNLRTRTEYSRANVAQALADAAEGDTLQLLSDIPEFEGEIQFPANKLTLDGDGHAITAKVTANGNQILNVNGMTATIKNVTIDAQHAYTYCVQAISDANLTVENVAFLNGGMQVGDVDPRAGYGAGLHVNNASVVVKGDFTAESGMFPFTGILVDNTLNGLVFQDAGTVDIGDDLLLVGGVAGQFSMSDDVMGNLVASLPAGYTPYGLGLGDPPNYGFVGVARKAWNDIIADGKEIMDVASAMNFDGLDKETTPVTLQLAVDTTILGTFTFEDANFTVNGNGNKLSGTIVFADSIVDEVNGLQGSFKNVEFDDITLDFTQLENLSVADALNFDGVDIAEGATLTLKMTEDQAASNANADALAQLAASTGASVVLDVDGYTAVIENDELYIRKAVAQVVRNDAVVGSYATLAEAIAAAQDGDTVLLLKDIALNEGLSVAGESAQYGAFIDKSITIDGNGYTITSTVTRAIGVKGASESEKVDVTFKDLTVRNAADSAVCIITRGGIGDLVLDGVTLDTNGTTVPYNQPLTIGGTQSSAANVTIKDSVIKTNDQATQYYAVLLWNPVDMVVTNSTIMGWACLYFKEGSADSSVEIVDSTLVSKGLPGSSNNFAAIVVEDDDITVNVTGTQIDIIAAEGTYQGIALPIFNDDIDINLGEGNTVTLTGEEAVIGFNANEGDVEVSGGMFNVPVPEEFCADGFIPAPQDSETGRYTVKVGTYVAAVCNAGYVNISAPVSEASDDVYLDMWGFYQMEGMLDANGNACPQYVSITDTTLYRDTGVADSEAAGAWVSAKYIFDNYLATGKYYAGAQTAVLYEEGVVPREKFETLGDAIVAAQDGDTVQLLTNITLTAGVEVVKAQGGTFVLDGAGYTITAASPLSNSKIIAVYIEGKASDASAMQLDVKNLTIKSDGLKYGFVLDSMQVAMSNVVVRANGGTAFCANTHASVTIDDCTIANTGSHTESWRDTALAVSYMADVTVNSGTFTSENGWAAYIFTSGGTIGVKGGTFSGKVRSSADTVGENRGDATITISGGEFSNVELTTAHDSNLNATIAVSGGWFSAQVPAMACAEGFEPTGALADAPNAAVPYTVGYAADIIYPIEGTDGVPIALAWATNNTSVVSEGVPVTAADVPNIITALSENGANKMPRWQSYVLGLNPADATAVLRLGATAKDATTVTITGSVDTMKFPSISNVTVTFRLAAQNGAEWTDIATGAETPSFDVSLDDVAGKVLTIFADIVTK